MKLLLLAGRLAALALLPLAPLVAHGQAYPSRPVKVVVPYAPGGAPDVIARILGTHVGESTGQSVVVDNRPGGGGIPAAEVVKGSAPDGYTLLMSDIQQLAINPYLFSKLPYNPATDFKPVALVATIPLYVVVQSSLNINTLPELVAYAKAHPGQLNYGSSGIGSIHHITMESLKAAFGIDIVHVPYKGAGQSVPAFLAGDVQVLISALPALAEHLKTGKGGKLIAVTTLKRSPQTPDVPAVSEFVPGFDYSSEMGLVAPAGTPQPVIDKLSTEILKALKNPDSVKKLADLGAVVVASTPQQYAENIQQNLQKFSKAVKVSGARVD
jgi:tripartite-type tricarboxylate transporter receptor subunit TctC